MKAIVCLIPACLLSISATAGASHKAWLLVDSSVSCRPERWATNDGWNSEFGNPTASFRWAVCPVTLGGIFGSNGSVSFPRAESALAEHGEVYVYDGSSNGAIQCSAAAYTTTGSVLWSRDVFSSGTGAQILRVLDANMNTWGGMLGNSRADIRSLVYRCALPAIGPSPSGIRGYSVALCQAGPCDDLQQ